MTTKAKTQAERRETLRKYLSTVREEYSANGLNDDCPAVHAVRGFEVSRYASAATDGSRDCGLWVDMHDTFNEARECLQHGASSDAEYPWAPISVCDLDTGDVFAAEVRVELTRVGNVAEE